MTFSFPKRAFALLASATLSFGSLPAQEEEVELPMWRGLLPTNVVPQVATSENEPEEEDPGLTTYSLTTQSQAAADPDIVALAVSLGNDPLKIFNFVRNKIVYEHYYGLKRGAVMTLVEGRGNDYDQCALLKALLVAAGQADVSYVTRLQEVNLIGNDGKNTADWLGTPEEPFPEKTFSEAFDMLIPTDWTTAGISEVQAKRLQYSLNIISTLGSPSVGTSSDYMRAVFPRVWIRLGTGAQAKNLDPSFKRSEWVATPDLTALAGYSRAALLTAATGSDTESGPGWVQRINQDGLTSYLNGLAGTLADTLLDQYPNSSVEEIIGGRRVIPENATSLSECFPLGNTFSSSSTETEWTGDIPEDRLVKVRFKAGTIDYTVPTAELGDDRVSLSFILDTMKLWVDGVQKDSTSVTGATINLTTSVIHPGTIGTRSKTNTYKKGDSYSYALIHAFSPTGKSLHRRYQKLTSYLDSGLGDNSKEVRSELLNIMGVTWLYQTQLVLDLLAARQKVIMVNHNRFGRVGQEAGFYIDVGLEDVGSVGNGGSEENFEAAFYGRALFASAMEHGIIEQMQPGYSGMSTVNLIRKANDQGRRLYLADNNNWKTGPAQDRVRSHLLYYDPTVKDAIEVEIEKGRKAFMPNFGSIVDGIWKGSGYMILGSQTLGLPVGETSNNLHAGMIIGGYGGGWSTSYGFMESTPVSDSINFDPIYNSLPPVTYDSNGIPSLYTPPMFGADPVDMATGAFTYGSTDLETGLEPSPRGLRMARYYTSNTRDSNTQNLGYGWTHDLHIRAEKRTASEEGLGLGSPRQAAVILTAILGVEDLFREDATPMEWGAATLAAGWGVDHLTNNAVSVVIGQQVIQFTTRPDGGFEPPTGSTMELLATGSDDTASYDLKQRHGNTISFEYDTSKKVHRAATITDPDGKSMHFDYLNDSRINYVEDSYGRRYTFAYTGTGKNALISSVTDSTGRSVSYGYGTDGEKNLSSFTDPEGKTENYDYSLAGDPTNQPELHRIRRVRDQLGRTVTENDYDPMGRVGVQRLHGDPAKAYTLHYADRITTETNPLGGVTSYFYDEKGRSIATEDPDGNRVSWEYDGQDHVIGKTTASGETTVYHYNARHNVTQIDHPRGGGSTVVAYDALDRVDLVTDPDGHQTDTVYNIGNTKDRPDSITDASGTTTYQYKTEGPGIGRVWKMTTPEGLETELEYDETYGHPDWVKKPGGFKTDFTYDARGDLQSMLDPNGVTSAYLYNKRRQATKTTADSGGADQAVEDTAYDDAGNVASVTSPEDNGGQRFKVRSEYSPTKKVLFSRTTDEDGEGMNDPVTETRYDQRDWEKEIVDPLSRLTSITPKPNGQLRQTTLPLGRTSSQVLDGDDRPTSITKPGSSSDRITTMAYGVSAAGDKTMGFPKTVTTTPDGLGITDEYDRGGNLRYHTNRKGDSWEFRYDGLGRRTEVITPLDAAANRSHLTEYYPRGAVKKVTEPSGQVTDYTYDSTNGRLTKVTDDIGTIESMLYDANGNLNSSTEKRGGDPKTTLQTFDHQNRLLSRTDENGQTIGYRYYPSGKLKKLIYPGGTENGIGHVEYTWWKSGQLKEVIDRLDSTTAPRVTKYEWNADGKLSKVSRPGNKTFRQIKYDAAGRPAIVEEYAAGGKLIFVHKHGYYPSDEMAWRYEMPAKRTSGLPPPTTAAMTYDADNRLATWGGMSIIQDADGNMTGGPAPSGTSPATYTYDARNRLTGALGFTYTYDSDGHRVGVTGPSETTLYTIDGSSDLSKTLVRDKDGTITRYVWGAGLLYEVNGSGSTATTTTYHYDGTGNTIALTDGDGKVIERIGYTPLGTIEHRVNLTGTPHDTPFLFTGFFGNQSDDNGLLYMRARYYHPRLARFLNADPAREGWNWYGYAAGNPIGFVDPSGLGIDEAMDMVQSTLSFLGMTPVFGAAFDIVNAGISVVRGDLEGAAVSLASAAPGLGDFVGGAKILAGGAAGYKAATAAFIGGAKIVSQGTSQAHHSIPKFLGGNQLQFLTRLDTAVHTEFHSLLRQNLRASDIPLNVGGRGGSAADWARYFNTNPGSQRTALDAVLKSSRAIDFKYGTQITNDFWNNVVRGNFKPFR